MIDIVKAKGVRHCHKCKEKIVKGEFLLQVSGNKEGITFSRNICDKCIAYLAKLLAESNILVRRIGG